MLWGNVKRGGRKENGIDMRQREMRGTKGKWKGTDGKRRLRGVTEKDNKAGDRSA